MKTPLHISKISPPRLPRILDRSRLIQRLEENQDKKLILILGQAAQGKSTLAASYAQKSEAPWAWMNLGIEESDPVNFFYLLVQSLQHALNDVDLSPIQDYPAKAMGPREEIPLYREWTHALFDRIPVPIRVFLDGLDRLAPDAPSYQFLQVLLDNEPPDISFVMLSREMPPLEIQRLKMSRKAAIIDNKELAFRPDEVKAFFRDTRGISFTAGQLKKIHQASEGWIGGLILLCEYLDRLPRDQRNEYIAEILSEQFKEEVFKYFGEEIFSSQPALVRDFLIKSAMFETIDPGLIKDFIETENAEKILQGLSRRNLFVVSVFDSQKGQLFRYHQLFRDFLQTKLASQIDNKSQRALFLKAGNLLEQKEDLEESVKFFLEGKAYAQASSIIKQIGMDLVKKGRTGDLAQWLQTLPEDLIQEDPWLLFYLSMTRRFTDMEENIRRLQKAVSLFDYQGDVRGHLISLAFLIETSFVRGRDLIPLRVLLEQGEMLLQTFSDNRYPYEMAILWLQVGFGFILRGGNPRKGFSACEHSYLISKNLGDLQLQFNSLVYALMALALLGEWGPAENTLEKINKLMEKNAYPELQFMFQINYIQFCICSGDFKKAQHVIQSALAGTKEHGLIYLYPPSLMHDLMLKVYLDEYAKAEEIANRLIRFSSSMDNMFLQGVASLLLGISFYRKGDFQKCKGSIEYSRKILSSDEARSETHLYATKIMMGLIAYQLKEEENAEKELQEALDYFSDISSYHYLVDIRFALSFLTYKRGQVTEATAHLLSGFNIVKKNSYYHFWFLNQSDLLKACTLAIELEVREAMDYAAHLLCTRLAPQAGPEIERLLQHSKPKIRKKAKEIRQAIHRTKMPHVRIKTLGGFGVFRDDFPIQDKKWQGNQPKRLLKAIIARGSGSVSKEIIIEDLWPEGRPKAVEKNFKVTLHRLRKALEPKTEKTLGSSYIHLKDKFICLDKERCHVDVDEFLSLREKGKQKEKEGYIKEALSLYEESAKRYKGDFLVEDLYVPWAGVKREELRKKYIELLYRMAELQENRGASKKSTACYKKVVQSDPFAEKAYQRLMTLYSNRGKRSAALKVYEECKKALQTGLDTEPDELTTSLYKKILET
jgi:ATP/maltotriose-dependent transcriptional regulator MalT/DNA-binding SARP family transcriptional activator